MTSLFISDTVGTVLGSLFLLFLGLGWLARRRPDIAWLQPFNINPQAHLTQAQRDRLRKRASRHAGYEIILLGFAFPVIYLIGKVMMFDSPTPLGLAISGAGAFLCFTIGMIAIAKNR